MDFGFWILDCIRGGEHRLATSNVSERVAVPSPLRSRGEVRPNPKSKIQNLKSVLVLLAVVGCAPGPKPVYVDVDAILREDVPKRETPIQLPQPPASMPGMAFSIRAQPERVVHDQGDKIRTSIEQIEKSQKDAIQALNTRLRALYATEITRFARVRLAKVYQSRADAYDDVNGAIWKAFQAYGHNRGPLMAALAVDVGWPDPNPTSKGDPSNRNIAQKKTYERDKQLRADISALDAAFATQMKGLMAQVQAKSDADLEAAEAAIEAFREELNKKADAEAARQVRATPKQLDIQLAGARTTVLPAIPARTVLIAPSSPNSPAPQVPSSGIGNGSEDRRKMVEQELRSWLGLNRLTLARPDKGVPDVTKEFRAWRKTLLSDGP